MDPSINETKRTEKGQSLVELAIGFMVLLFVLGGTVDLGRMFFAYIAIRDAAQEGAVYASITDVKSVDDIRGRVRTSSSNPVDMSALPDSDIQVGARDMLGNPIVDINDACAGDQIDVTVEYSHQFIMPLTTTIVGNKPLPLKAEIHYTVLTPLCP